MKKHFPTADEPPAVFRFLFQASDPCFGNDRDEFAGRIFERCRPVELGLAGKSSVQVALCRNSAGKQFFQIPAFQSPALYDDVINFIHGNLS
jgi:hypothetical protein